MSRQASTTPRVKVASRTSDDESLVAQKQADRQETFKKATSAEEAKAARADAAKTVRQTTTSEALDARRAAAMHEPTQTFVPPDVAAEQQRLYNIAQQQSKTQQHAEETVLVDSDTELNEVGGPSREAATSIEALHREFELESKSQQESLQESPFLQAGVQQEAPSAVHPAA